jgi:hypothetical protein
MASNEDKIWSGPATDIVVLSTKEAIYKRPLMYLGPDFSVFVKEILQKILDESEGELVNSFTFDNGQGIVYRIETKKADLKAYKFFEADYISETFLSFEESNENGILEFKIKFDPEFLNRYFLATINVGVGLLVSRSAP